MSRLTLPSLLTLLLIVLAACGASAPDAPASSATSVASTAPSSPTASTLTVFAAASLTDAFGEIGRRFEAANPGVRVSFNFAGSQQLAQQIAQGAPADVFASANRTQLERVIETGQVISGTQQTFVRNRLVVIYPSDNPAGLSALPDLARPGIKLVLAAKEVPVGQYALDFLQRASEVPQYTAAYSETVLANVVSYEENVRAVLSKVALGEADAGIVYSSDISGESADQVGRLDIPDELNTIAAYPIAPIATAPNAALAERFIAYVLGPEGQQILSEYGFTPVGGAGGATGARKGG